MKVHSFQECSRIRNEGNKFKIGPREAVSIQKICEDAIFAFNDINIKNE